MAEHGERDTRLLLRMVVQSGFLRNETKAMWMNNRGFSLLSLVLGASIGLLVLSLGSMSLFRSGSFGNAILAKGSADTDLILAYDHILRIGRFADYCAWTPAALPSENAALYCEVNFSAPREQSKALLRPVRFVHRDGSLVFERLTTPGDFSTWTAVQTYRGITAFRVCDDQAMRAGTCDLLPTRLAEAHVASLDSRTTWENQFFRFQIGGEASGRQASDYERTLQGAFFSRNGTKIAVETGIAMEWRGQ